MYLTDWDVGRLVGGQFKGFIPALNGGLTFDYYPVFGSVVVLLKRQLGTGLNYKFFDLVPRATI